MALNKSEIDAICVGNHFSKRTMERVVIDEQELVQVRTDTLDTEMSKTLVTELNKLWANFQLGNVNEEGDMRELWYQCRFTTLARTGADEIDYKGSSEQQFIAFHGAVKSFAHKLAKYYGIDYWGMARDLILNIRVKDTCEVFDQYGMKVLQRENRKSIAKQGCFCLIAEKKKTAKDIFTSLKNQGIPGIAMSTSGYGVVEIVLTMLEYKEQCGAGDQFYVLVAHDLDVNGIMIYLDLQRWFPGRTFSVGISPDFLNFVADLDFNILREPYKPKTEHKTGVKNMIKKVRDLGMVAEADEAQRMLNMCGMTHRVELNTVTGYRKSQGRTGDAAAEDLVNWAIDVINRKCKVWNLNRVASHSVSTPKPRVDAAENWLTKIVWKPFRQILKDHDRVYTQDWREPADERKDEFKQENKNYSGNIANYRKVYNEQDKELTEICMTDETNTETVDEIYEKLGELTNKLVEIFDIEIHLCPECGAPAKKYWGNNYTCLRCENSFEIDEEEEDLFEDTDDEDDE